jgi:glycosyltransferase involved in cell wall biosynthesis
VPARPLRVAVLDHTAELGGAELALCRLLDAVPPEVAEVTVVLFEEGPLVARLGRAGHRVDVVPLDRGLLRRQRADTGSSVLRSTRDALRVLPYAVRLGRRLRRLDVDVVHTTSLKADLVGIVAAAVARRPLVWHVHDRISPDYLPERTARVLRWLARRIPRHVVVNSRATAETLPRVRRLTTAYPGITSAQVAPARERLPEPAVVGIVGRLSDTKGQLDFVRAAALVRVRHPEARFRIVGSAMFGQEEYERQVREEVAELGLVDRVDFTGFSEDPSTELDGMAVCVHASPTPEPFGQVVVEAMARGVPVVATRGGGVTEIVEPGTGEVHGTLVNPHDTRAMASAVIAILDHPVGAQARAEHARTYAAETFAIDRTAAAVTDVWRHVARPARRRSPAPEPTRSPTAPTGTAPRPSPTQASAE